MKDPVPIDSPSLRNSALAHLYGVSLGATQLTRDTQLSWEILAELTLTSPKETKIICFAIYHHDDKLMVGSPMDELLKDTDITTIA